MSSRPLNGEMVTVRPTGRTGRLLVKLPSTHLCGENGPSQRVETASLPHEDSEPGLPQDDTILLRIRALGMNTLELLSMRTSLTGFVLEAKQIFVCMSFSHRFPRWLRGKEPACDAFDPWVGKIHWRRAWPPTPGFLPGEYHGQRGLLCYNLWSHKELDMTAHRTFTHSLYAYSNKFGFILRNYSKKPMGFPGGSAGKESA